MVETYIKQFPDEEQFIISISGNAPEMIIQSLKHDIDTWLNKMGSTVYFKKRKRLKLTLNIVKTKKRKK